ncbi:MAG: reductase [Synergistales bacterium]|nr:reductase [Synergistales bacterium]
MSHLKYIDRTRAYYASQGYEKPYNWAQFDEVPFAKLSKPLSECTVALISTSDVAIRKEGEEVLSGDGDTLIGNVYSLPSDTPEELFYTKQEHFDRVATHLDDVNSYFPITRLHEAAEAGRIGKVAARAHGVYTAYSQRKTKEIDAPEVLRRCREDGVDVAVLTPVCPVCHQTISLVARHLETNGIPTVVMAVARDIVETAGVARFVFVDFPLGNPTGEPFNRDQQQAILELALGLFETAEGPRTTVQAPFKWSKGDEWKDLIFTEEQPFLEGEAYDNWMKAKEKYREIKQEGRA